MAPLSQIDLKNVGKPKVPGITNTAVLPSQLQTPSTSLGVKAKAPSASVSKPNTVLPSNQIAKPSQSQELERIKQEALKISGEVGKMSNATQPKVTGPSASSIKMPEKFSTPTYGGIIGDLIKRANDTSAIDKASQRLMDSRMASSNKIADIKSQPIPLEFQQGRAQVVQQAAQEQQSALQQGVQNALTARGQDISALQNAGTLAQPVQIAPGSTLTSPMTGSSVAGGLGGYTPYQAAQNFFGLQSSYPDAKLQYNSALTPEQNLAQAQQALSGSPTYQKSTYGQPGANSVLGAAGISSGVDLTQKASEIQAIANGAEANFSLLVNTAMQGGVNDMTVPALNRLQQNVQRGLASSAAVTLFRATLESVRAQYASILGGGAATDQARNAAAQQIPDDISLQALQALESQLKYEAQNRVAGYQQQIQAISGNQNTSGTTQINGKTYVKVNGGWQLQR